MLITRILTANPNTGTEYSVPVEFLQRVRRSAEILDRELEDLTQKYALEARWLFVPNAGGVLEVELELASREYDKSTFWRFTRESLKDDESALRNLRPAISNFSISMMEFMRTKMDGIQKQLQLDLAALSSLGEG